MRGTHGGGGYSSATNHVTEPREVFGRSLDRRAVDVLGEDEARLDLSDDPEHFGPEVGGVVPASRGRAERLAGEASGDEVDLSAEGSAVEGPNVVPNREALERPVQLSP